VYGWYELCYDCQECEPSLCQAVRCKGNFKQAHKTALFKVIRDDISYMGYMLRKTQDRLQQLTWCGFRPEEDDASAPSV